MAYMIGIEQMRREVSRALEKARSIVRRGLITLMDDEYFGQVECYEGEMVDEVELWQQFGVTSRPPAGGEALIAQPGGRGEGGIIVATTDRAYRPTGLESGDSVLYAKTASGGGQAQVHAKADGDVDLTPGTGKTVNVGGSTYYLLLGNLVVSTMSTFFTALQGASSWGQVNTAAGTALTALSTWPATKGKVE